MVVIVIAGVVVVGLMVVMFVVEILVTGMVLVTEVVRSKVFVVVVIIVLVKVGILVFVMIAVGVVSVVLCVVVMLAVVGVSWLTITVSEVVSSVDTGGAKYDMRLIVIEIVVCYTEMCFRNFSIEMGSLDNQHRWIRNIFHSEEVQLVYG